MNDTTLRECKSNHFETFQNEIETNFNYSAPYNNLKSEILQITYLTLPPPEKAVKRRALLIQPQKCIKHTKISLWNTKQKNRPKEEWKMYSKAVSFKFGTLFWLSIWEMRDSVCIPETSLQKQMDFRLLFHAAAWNKARLKIHLCLQATQRLQLAKMVNVSHRVMGLLDAKLITDPFTPAPVTISFSCL